MHSKLTRCFFFFFSDGDLGGGFSGYGYITKRAEKQRSNLLTSDQTDADLSQAQQKSGYLKGLANDVRPRPYQLKRTYWLIVEIYGQIYFIYCISFLKNFNKLYIL